MTTAYPVSALLPREVATGVHWLGGCSDSGAWPGRSAKDARHEHLSSYLVIGTEKTLLVDTGHFSMWGAFRDQLLQALDGRTLDYVFPSHQEIPHAGNLGRLLTIFPDAVAVGDTREYHLYFPEIDSRRLHRCEPGDRLSLGSTDFVFVDPIWFDLTGTLWGYATATETLFSADGLGYYHEHTPDVCGLLPDETPDQASEFGILKFALPFVGMKYHDMAPGVLQYRALAATHPIRMVCSAHGAPVGGTELISITEQGLAVIEENQISISGPSVLEPAVHVGGNE